MTHAPRHAQRGLTLMEAVMVIMLTGIVGVMISGFVRQPVDAYVDLTRRTELTDAADIALRRLGRELRQALPNSVRVDPTGRFLEYLPVRSAGRYRAAPRADGSGDALDFGAIGHDSFEVLGPAVSAATGDTLVIHNLGLPGADAYEGSSRRALVTTGNTLASVTYDAAGTPFPYASPNHRFHIVGRPVTLACLPAAAGGELRRYTGYAIQPVQPMAAGVAPLAGPAGPDNALVSPHVTGCSFSYTAGAGSRNALVTLRLALTSGGESIALVQQVQVEASP